MTIRRAKEKKYQGVLLKSGRFYKFRYKPHENDPRPTIIFMHWFSGTHPNTGRQWRFFQGINFTYIPRAVRKRFIKEWMEVLERNPNIIFSYRRVKSRYPWLKIAVRRYQYDPATYIRGLEEIPLEDVPSEVIQTWKKDFSKKIVTAIRSKFKKTKKALQKRKAEKTKKRLQAQKRLREQREKRRRDAERLRQETIRNRNL